MTRLGREKLVKILKGRSRKTTLDRHKKEMPVSQAPMKNVSLRG